MDYRGKQPVLLALFRGLYCPFCRRQLSQLALSAERLKKVGVAILAGVATAPERTRLYYRFHPPRLRVAADPDLTTHRAYGLPHLPKTPAVMQVVQAAAADMARELGIPTIPGQAEDAILRRRVTSSHLLVPGDPRGHGCGMRRRVRAAQGPLRRA